MRSSSALKLYDLKFVACPAAPSDKTCNVVAFGARTYRKLYTVKPNSHTTDQQRTYSLFPNVPIAESIVPDMAC